MDVSNFHGSPALSPRQAFLRAMAVVHRLPLLAMLRHALEENRPGRPAELPVEAFLVGTLYYALLHPKDDMHLTKVSNEVLQMSPSMKWELGLKKESTYRKVHSDFTRIVRLFDDVQHCAHTHPTIDKETGEVLPCPTNCPHPDLNAHTFLNQLLDASCNPHPPDTTHLAIDSTAYESWAKLRFTERLETEDQNPGTKNPDEEDSVHESQRPRGFPRGLQPGNKTRYTKDPDAREGYRTASDNQPGRTFWGYDIHLLTNVSKDKTVIPHLIRSSAIARAGSDTTTEAGLKAIDSFIEARSKSDPSRPPIKVLLADRGYSLHLAKYWQLPLIQRGIAQVLDLTEQQRGQHPSAFTRTVSIDGGLFVDALPKIQRELPGVDFHTPEPQRKANQALHDRRLAYAFRPSSKIDPITGTQRFKGPALSGTLRCKNNKKSQRGPHALPLTSCAPGCACSKTLTLGPENQARERQWPLFGTTAWAKSYARRTAIESVNAEIKHHRAGFKRGYTHVFELTKNTILLAFGLTATNILILRDWHFNRNEQDPWADPQKEEPWEFGKKPPKTRAARRAKLKDLIQQSAEADPGPKNNE
ncbi:hypothetical protein [Arthrobacter ramosus]